MTTALQIIKGALRRINSYMSGEQISAPDANDCLETLNDMLDSWSTDEATVYSSNETILTFQGLKYQYSIGPGGDFSTDINGNPVPRPLRITNGFTRISQIDFPMEVTMNQTRYAEIGLKNVPAPWPIALYYNPTSPLGTLYFYPNPSSSAELHLFVDLILSEFATINTSVNLPPGYVRAMKWGLAREICTEFGFPLIPAIEKLAKESLDMVKSLNQIPAQTATFDAGLLSMGRRANASWILIGGLR